MHLTVILRVTGILLTLFSLAMLLPVLVALVYGEQTMHTFLLAFAITMGVGLLLFLGSRDKRELRSGDGFFITVLFYSGLGLFGAIPLYLAESVDATFTDAAFESLSGLTTTGATVLSGLDELPRSILFYRQLLQWLGGMGIIVLAVAVLPMLGIGGMQLYRAEFTGPMKDNKLTPRITETAKALWYLYLGITIACASAYWAAGMSLFDAICHSFSTVAIGGFSTHDASIGYFASPAIEAVAIVFMIFAGINFGLHFLAWNRWDLRMYWQDREIRLYLAILTAVAAIVCMVLLEHPEASATPWRDGIFQAVSTPEDPWHFMSPVWTLARHHADRGEHNAAVRVVLDEIRDLPLDGLFFSHTLPGTFLDSFTREGRRDDAIGHLRKVRDAQLAHTRSARDELPPAVAHRDGTFHRLEEALLRDLPAGETERFLRGRLVGTLFSMLARAQAP
jgi:trk system potassium uptake protein TrkH